MLYKSCICTAHLLAKSSLIANDPLECRQNILFHTTQVICLDFNNIQYLFFLKETCFYLGSYFFYSINNLFFTKYKELDTLIIFKLKIMHEPLYR